METGDGFPDMQKTISSNEYAIFLDCLRNARKQAGLTQEQLAERLGQTQSFVSKIERGERRMDVIELRAFCRAIGTTLQEFASKLESVLEKRRECKDCDHGKDSGNSSCPTVDQVG